MQQLACATASCAILARKGCPWLRWIHVHVYGNELILLVGFAAERVFSEERALLSRRRMPANKDPSWRQKVSIIRHQVQMRGVARTAADVMVFYLRYIPEWDRSFDRRHGTDTAGTVAPPSLGIEDLGTREAAVPYLPSPEDVTRWMLQQLPRLGVDPARTTFVDFGCGKGRVILLASELGFAEVVGVEISESLVTIARRNLCAASRLARRCRSVRVEQADAGRFVLPAGNLMVHFYHPFNESILRQVVRNLATHGETHGARIDVAYLLPTGVDEAVESVFASVGHFRQLSYAQSASTEYDWTFFTNQRA